MSRNIGFCQFCLSCSGFLFGIGSRWEDVKSPQVDRLLLLVFFSLPNLKELQRFNIWLLLLSSYVEATITTKKFKCIIVWQWCKRQRGKAGPKIAQMFVPWQIKSRDTLWLLGLFNWFVIVRFVQLICVCWYKLWTYHPIDEYNDYKPTKCISCDQYFQRAKFTFSELQLCLSCQHVLFSSSLDCLCTVL